MHALNIMIDVTRDIWWEVLSTRYQGCGPIHAWLFPPRVDANWKR
jgi:hypothetical protein